MTWSLKHAEWLVDTGERLKTADGKEVEVWELQHQNDEKVLSSWAKHFRNHYCLDAEIDSLRVGEQTRKDYLNGTIFPSSTSKLGPAIRAGDFGEILVADYLQWHLGFWVPRVRWSSKNVQDESAKGSDVVGFKFYKKDGTTSSKDILSVFETKTHFSKRGGDGILRKAINDSAKDHRRIAESLNSIKRKLLDKGKKEEAQCVERFQNLADCPYIESYGAAALFDDESFKPDIATKADCKKITKSDKSKEFTTHPNRENLVLLIIKGPDMMDLVRELYRRAADEA